MNKKWILGVGMAVGMLGMGSAADASDKVYCVATAFSNDRPTVARVFKTKAKNNGYQTECSACEVKWSKYLEANYDDYFEFTTNIRGPYDERSEAEDEFEDYKSNARNQWHQKFYHASDFSCSGR